MEVAKKQELTILATGRVQGVGFRRFVEKKANLYNVTGWVKNNSDGTVSIKAYIDKKIINTFLDEIQKGNLFIRVDNLSIESTTEVNYSPETFEVRF